MVRLKIKVTKEILEKSLLCGVDSNVGVGHNCAIALAVREIFPHSWVCRTEIVVYKSEEDIHSLMGGVASTTSVGVISLPDSAKNFITVFDLLHSRPNARLYMNELEFEVKIPDSILEAINIDEIKELLKNSSILELKEV